MEPARQLSSIEEIEQLPYHEFIQTASKLIVLPEVHILARAKLLETLRQLNECNPVFYLTIEEKLVKVIPKDLPKPQQQSSYRQLCVFSDHYGNEDALLSSVLKEEFTLQSAIVYPVYDTYIEDPRRWFQLTVEAYTGKTMYDGTEYEKQDFLKTRENFAANDLLPLDFISEKEKNVMKNKDSTHSICLQFERVSVLFKGMHETFLMYKMNF